MKKLFIVGSAVLMMAGCTETSEPCPPERAPVGYNVLAEDFPGTVIGNNETVNQWRQYLEYHNERNFDGIESMDADSIRIYPPNGELVVGKKAHREQLEKWLANEDVRWKPVWGTSIKSPNDTSDGAFVIAVSDLTTVHSEDSVARMNNMFTAWIQGGKIWAFWIYDRKFAADELQMIESAEAAEAQE